MEYVKKPVDNVHWQFWFLGCYTVDRDKEKGDEVIRVLMTFEKKLPGKRVETLYVTDPLDAKRQGRCRCRVDQEWSQRQLMNHVCRHRE